MSDCGCNKTSVKGVNKEYNRREESYITQSTVPRASHSKKQIGHTSQSSTPNSLVNSICNTELWGDDFILSFGWNNEPNPETGIAKSHLFPVEILGWCPKDTPERCHPCNPGIKWERKNGNLIVRDTTIKGDRDILFEQGGQIIMKLSSQVPSCALGEGYSAHDLVALGDAIAPYFDGLTIKRDPTNENKFTASAQAVVDKSVYYVEQGSQNKFFTYSDTDKKTYYTVGSLDNKVKVKTDGTTIIGDGVTIPLQVRGSGGTGIISPTAFSIVNQSNRTVSGGGIPLTSASFDTNAKQYATQETLTVVIPKSTLGKRQVYIKGYVELSFNDESGWDVSSARAQSMAYDVSLQPVGGSIYEPGTTTVATISESHNVSGNNWMASHTEKINVGGVFTIDDTTTSINMNIVIQCPKTAANPDIQIKKSIINLSIF